MIFLILRIKVAKLNEIIVNFQDVIQIKDTQLEDMHRKNARLMAELKKQQRYNRNLKRNTRLLYIFFFCEAHELDIYEKSCKEVY